MEDMIHKIYTCDTHLNDAVSFLKLHGVTVEGIEYISEPDRNKMCTCGTHATITLNGKRNSIFKKPRIRKLMFGWLAIVVAFLNTLNAFLSISLFQTPQFNIVGIVIEIFLAEFLYIVLGVIIPNFVTVANNKKRKKGDE